MTQENEFHAVEFFRKVRDQQAAMLKGKSGAEIIAFFASFKKTPPGLTRRSTGRSKRQKLHGR